MPARLQGAHVAFAAYAFHGTKIRGILVFHFLCNWSSTSTTSCLKSKFPEGYDGGLAVRWQQPFSCHVGWQGVKSDKRCQHHCLVSLSNNSFVHQIHLSLFNSLSPHCCPRDRACFLLAPAHRCSDRGLEKGLHCLKVSQPTGLELKLWCLSHDATLPQTDPGQGPGLGC